MSQVLTEKFLYNYSDYKVTNLDIWNLSFFPKQKGDSEGHLPKAQTECQYAANGEQHMSLAISCVRTILVYLLWGFPSLWTEMRDHRKHLMHS